MKVISWNIQGAEKSQVTQEVKILAKIHKPDIVFLLETVVYDQNISKILPQMGFDHFDYISPNNHSGGIAVLWSNGTIYASVLSKERRAIHMLVHDPNLAKHSIISGIYTPAQAFQKDNFWRHLIDLHHTFDLP